MASSSTYPNTTTTTTSPPTTAGAQSFELLDSLLHQLETDTTQSLIGQPHPEQRQPQHNGYRQSNGINSLTFNGVDHNEQTSSRRQTDYLDDYYATDNNNNHNQGDNQDEDDNDNSLSPPASPSLFPRVPANIVPQPTISSSRTLPPPAISNSTTTSSSRPNYPSQQQQGSRLPPSPPTQNDIVFSDDEYYDDDDFSDDIAQPTVAQRVTQVAIENAIHFTTRTTSLDRSNSRIRFAETPTRSSSKRNGRPSASSSRRASRTPMAQIVNPNKPVSSPAILSDLADKFVSRVVQLNSTRRIFSTEEYPLSFTGEEAVKIVRDLLPPDLRTVVYRKVARLLMHTSPPLISPIQYSEKSLRKNTLYDSPSEIYTVVDSTLNEGFAQGVYSIVATCYSPFCEPNRGGCYSTLCPNRFPPRNPNLLYESNIRRNMSLASSSVASSHDTMLSRAWQASVPREILQSTPEQEIARQEAICELIYTEEDYSRDLNLLDELFAKPLRTAQCIDEDRRDIFCDSVFNNYLELLSIHKDLYRELRDYQSICQARSTGGFVDQVGNIFLRHIHRFMKAYTEYGPHVALAEYIYKKEAANNMLFSNFLKEKEKQPECRKLEFRHFLVLPVTRLQRYLLLLKQVMKKTEEDHPDKDDLTRCYEEITEVIKHTDALAASKRMTVRLYEINDLLRFKSGERFVDLRLSERGRQLLFEGKMTRRRSNMGVWDTFEHQVFLFDHYLLITKPKVVNEKVVQYTVWRRPIPLELLHVKDGTEGFALGSQQRTQHHNNGSTFTATGTSIASPLSPVSPTTSPGLSPTAVYMAQVQPQPTPPSSFSSNIIFEHLGRYGGEHHLQVETAQIRMKWKQMIIDAKVGMEQAHPESKAFEVQALSDTTFALMSGPANYGKVTCSTAFVGARGLRMVAIGTELGVWMGIEGDTNNLRRVLTLSDVTQIAVLEEYHIFIVLADKIVTAYPLDSLDTTAPARPTEKASHKIGSNVSFFNTGVYDRRTLVVIMKKRGMDSLFRAFEPVCGSLRDPRNAKYLVTKTSLFKKSPSWFKLYKEFYIGAESSSIHFLKARLAITCVRGFEIINLNDLSKNHNLPELQDPDFAFVSQRADQLTPLGMFKINSEHFLLCYDQFAFMVNMSGRLMRNNYLCIEWEGTPRSIAFSYPYVLAFDSRFIEVRHVETGQLVQVIAGENMQCIQYQFKLNDIAPPVIHGCMTHPFKPDYQYVFHLTENVIEQPVEYWR
ncbi:CNH domain-containing protein [Phascolomyces articulosus]|uniref:CNH domain-containing protein n=1 Tax=Phascolomyces articulosus TaxID=60185 RepID=A0AAD5K0I6_9FUNG|nr:CNH domain-containing protein [Phascolomyces articulosus]